MAAQIFVRLAQAERQMHPLAVTECRLGIGVLHGADVIVMFGMFFHARQMQMRLGEIGLESERLTATGDRRIELAQFSKRRAQIAVRLGGIGPECEGSSKAGDSLNGPA